MTPTAPTSLYNLRTDGDQFRITKFDPDGNIESTYLLSHSECECPAGSRPTCRHRQMLPDMLSHGLCSTHWFWDHDLHRAVDIHGMLKSNFDAIATLATGPTPRAPVTTEQLDQLQFGQVLHQHPAPFLRRL